MVAPDTTFSNWRRAGLVPPPEGLLKPHIDQAATRERPITMQRLHKSTVIICV